MINKKMLDNFKEELDDVKTEDLPTDREFALEIIKDLPPESALEAIEAYTWYYVCRVNEIIK